MSDGRLSLGNRNTPQISTSAWRTYIYSPFNGPQLVRCETVVEYNDESYLFVQERSTINIGNERYNVPPPERNSNPMLDPNSTYVTLPTRSLENRPRGQRNVSLGTRNRAPRRQAGPELAPSVVPPIARPALPLESLEPLATDDCLLERQVVEERHSSNQTLPFLEQLNHPIPVVVDLTESGDDGGNADVALKL